MKNQSNNVAATWHLGISLVLGACLQTACASEAHLNASETQQHATLVQAENTMLANDTQQLSKAKLATSSRLAKPSNAKPSKESLAFALIGDNPYTDENQQKYERLLDDINANPDLAWVLHLGDLKSSSLGCSDETLMQVWQRHDRLNMPFVLTPGDNDWFDCKRPAAGNWDRRERLAFIRQAWFHDPGNIDGLAVVSQAGASMGSDHGKHNNKISDKTNGNNKSNGNGNGKNKGSNNGHGNDKGHGRFTDYVENVRWQQSGVVFVNIHLVGITGLEGGLDLHAELMQAALAWLEEAFNVARQSGAKGVFIATQADPWLFSAEREVMDFFCSDCPWIRPGYEALDEALVKHTRAFAGQVVLAVGDTHIFRVDKPLYDGEQLVHNFTRVETFGHPSVHWIKVVVHPGSRHLFEFHQQLVPGNTD